MASEWSVEGSVALMVLAKAASWAQTSVEKQVELYIEKSVALKKSLYHDYFPEKGNNDKIWNTA